MDRKERLGKVQSLLENEGWQYLKAEIEKEISAQASVMDGMQSRGETDQAQYMAGIKRGMEEVLGKPERIRKSCLNVLERIQEAIR